MIEYIILGILQGVFEWIPVSSQGIVALFSNYFVKDLNAIDVSIFLHLGTFLAVMIFFYKDWLEILTFKNKELFGFIFIATAISGILGFLLYDIAKEIVMGGGLLFLMGGGLLLTSYFQKKEINFRFDKKYAPWLVGLLQGFSAIPGVSRSGSTIFGLSLFEKDPLQILKVSYLLSAPLVFCSSAYLYFKDPTIINTGSLVAFFFSFVFGVLTLKYLLKIVSKVNFSSFTLIFGILCLLGGIGIYLI